MLTVDTRDGAASDFHKFKESMLALSQADDVIVLTFVNWCAPAMHSSVQQDIAIGAVTANMFAGGTNASFVLMPVWSQNKQQLHTVQDGIMKSAVATSLDVSSQASLLFQKKNDHRDKRPLNYPIRIVKPPVQDKWD